MVNKPLIFTHLATSTNNTNGRFNATKVTEMIRILMQHDSSIKPNDIAIIMAKSKDNDMFNQLVETLSTMYYEMGISGDLVCYMSTAGDGRHNTLDWEHAEGKTKMLSIHGDKGKGHRVVFFLGLTERSIPKDFDVDKPSEIVPESLLNVAITRSTEYLFIGFTSSYPSRYLQSICDKLAEYAYIGYEAPKSDNIPEPYLSIIDYLQSNEPLTPNWNCEYIRTRVNYGSKSVLRVKEEISKDFDQASDLINHNWTPNSTEQFGTKQTIIGTLREDHFLILGTFDYSILLK